MKFALGTALAAAGAMGWAASAATRSYRAPTQQVELIDIGQGTTVTQATIRRTLVFVPRDYGKLVNITGGADKAMLWYERAGEIRNVRVSKDVLVRRQGILTIR
ncbi:MAG: hypothetical protein V3S11_03410 [Elusimicrobiota bacterium]